LEEEIMTQEQTSWKKYLQEMDVNVTVTTDDEKSESPFAKKDKKSDKGNPFEKKGKSDKKKGDNPFAKKDADGEDEPKEKKDNPFVAKKGKSDKKKGGNPFAKKDNDGGDEPKEKEDKSEKKDNPFVKKEFFLSWREWVEAKNS
jgi:nucleolar protein 58